MYTPAQFHRITHKTLPLTPDLSLPLQLLLPSSASDRKMWAGPGHMHIYTHKRQC